MKKLMQQGISQYMVEHNLKVYADLVQLIRNEWNERDNGPAQALAGVLQPFVDWFSLQGYEQPALPPEIEARQPRIILETRRKRRELEEYAQLYVGALLENAIDDISQYTLAELTEVSQPTWSRYWKRHEFWEVVGKILNRTIDDEDELIGEREETKERLIQAYRQVQDRAAKVKGKARVRKEMSIDPLLDYSQLGDIGKDAIDDLDDIDGFSRKDLIAELIGLRPEIGKLRLEEMSIEDLKILWRSTE